jgi:hypothetical protein
MSRIILISLTMLSLLLACDRRHDSTGDKVKARAMDDQIVIGDSHAASLRELRSQKKFLDLPGTNTEQEQKRLSEVLDRLLDRLLAEIKTNKSKAWVLDQFEAALIAVQYEDTEARERFGGYLEKIMDILEIQSSDGLLNKYL